MKTVDSQLEQMVLVAGLEARDPWIRNRVWADTTEDDFGIEPAREIRRRVAVLNQWGKMTGNCLDFSLDPALTKTGQEFLRISPQRRKAAAFFTRQRVDGLLTKLRQLRKARDLFDGISDILTTAQNSEADEAVFQTLMEKFDATRQAITDQQDKEIWQIGQGTSRESQIELVRDMTNPDGERLISSGLRGLDQHLHGGFAPGDLVVLSAAPSGGKSALASQMAINQYRSKLGVAYFSLEMTANQLRDRIVANILKEPFGSIRARRKTDDEFRKHFLRTWGAFDYEFGNANNCCLRVYDIKNPKFTPDQIRLELAGARFKCIYVDYLAKLYSKQRELWMAQREHASYLKSLAKQLDCVVVALTHLSDDDKVKYGRGPEEEADWWIWWRYGDEERESGAVDLRLAKARHGAKCFVPATFRLKYMQIDTSPPSQHLSTYQAKENEGDKFTDEFGVV